MLETLILLKTHCDETKEAPNVNSSTYLIGNAHHNIWHHQTADIHRIIKSRRLWQDTYETDTQGDSQASADEIFVDDDLESEQDTFSVWFAYQKQKIPKQTANPPPALFNVLHRFMMLSAEIAPVQGEINEIWMELACEMMVHAALQTLSTKPQKNINNDKEMDTDDSTEPKVRLADCFAYGFCKSFDTAFTPKELISDEDIDTEYMINDLFRSSELDDVTDVPIHPEVPIYPESEQNPAWTKIRHLYITEFALSASTPDNESSRYADRLGRLRFKYPYEPFERKIIECLDNYWRISMHKSMSGMPVLVQIEQGHLDGLNNNEFDDFLKRVGLRRDEDGILKMKL